MALEFIKLIKGDSPVAQVGSYGFFKLGVESSGGGEDKVVTYGIKIDLNNSNPETSVTYTDDAVGFDKSYMDFASDTFVYGSWRDKFPFNKVRPCLLKEGVVVKYLNPDNYTQDIYGNNVDITGAEGDVMIEIPKIYYRLHKDTNYQYIQISNTYQEGFCCLAHTYKGVEKDKVYIGAYQSYYDGNKSRSVSGVSATGYINLNTWRTYAHSQGEGYENFYWNLLVLLQCLYAIQFKNLNSQQALGYGWCNQSNYSTNGELNTKGMYYGTSTSGKVKFMGIEDFYGSRRVWVDGVYANRNNITIADATNSNMSFNGNGSGYINVGNTGLSDESSGYIKSIIGTNEGGFAPTNTQGSETTYYCDRAYYMYNTAMYYGGSNSDTTRSGVFYTTFSYTADKGFATSTGRLAFCG